MTNSKSTSRVANPLPQDLKHDRVVLSNREAEVISRTQNKSYADVAEELGIANSTVGTYYSRANEKLGEQLTVIETMLDQQRDAHRDENIEAIARYAVERLHDRGFDVKLEIQGQEDEEDEPIADGAAESSQRTNSTSTGPVDEQKLENKNKPRSDDTVKIGNTDIEMPVRIGDAINEEGTNYASRDDGISVRYWKQNGNYLKYIWLTAKKDQITVEVEYEERIEGQPEIVDSDRWRYKKLGFAFRRLYRECGVDLDDHNISFDFGQ